MIPQESVISGECRTPEQGSDPYSYPSGAGFLSLPAVGTQGGPLSAPWGLSLPSDDLPHYQQHYDQVRFHHEHLQQQLQDHIQQFLRQQEENQNPQSDTAPSSTELTSLSHVLSDPVVSLPGSSMYTREPSIHWRPNLPVISGEESSSRSYLFSSLRYGFSYLLFPSSDVFILAL